MNRRDKTNYYLDMAEAASSRGTCLRRNFGAIIVNHDEVIATGYAGAPRGRKNCCDIGTCVREKLKVPRGTRYELCRSVHAEANAIIAASRKDALGGVLYLVGREAGSGEYVNGAEPCSMCKRLIINAGIAKVVVRETRDTYKNILIESWLANDDSLEGYDSY